jgi:hypothetical protein
MGSEGNPRDGVHGVDSESPSLLQTEKKDIMLSVLAAAISEFDPYLEQLDRKALSNDAEKDGYCANCGETYPLSANPRLGP